MKIIKAKTESGEIFEVYVKKNMVDTSTQSQIDSRPDLPEYFLALDGQRLNLKGNKLISLDDELVLTII